MPRTPRAVHGNDLRGACRQVRAATRGRDRRRPGAPVRASRATRRSAGRAAGRADPGTDAGGVRRWRRRPRGRRARPRGRSAVSWRRCARRGAPRARRVRPRDSAASPRGHGAAARSVSAQTRSIDATGVTRPRRRACASSASTRSTRFVEVCATRPSSPAGRGVARAARGAAPTPGRARTPDSGQSVANVPASASATSSSRTGPSARVTRRSSRRRRRRSRPRPFTSGSASRSRRVATRDRCTRSRHRPPRRGTRRDDSTPSANPGLSAVLGMGRLRGRMPILAHVISAPCASPPSTSAPTRFT